MIVFGLALIMTRNNLLLKSPPHIVKSKIELLGSNLRTARLRRSLTIQDVATKIGAGVRAVRDAESGKISTSIGVYIALLWLYDLIYEIDNLADPLLDEVGLKLDELKKPQRARHIKRRMDNDF